MMFYQDDVIKWKHFPRYWPFVRGIHRLPVNSSHKGQWRRALMFSFIWTNGWVNKRNAGDLVRYCYVFFWKKNLCFYSNFIECLSNGPIYSKSSYKVTKKYITPKKATSHYLIQFWSYSPTPYYVTEPHWVKYNFDMSIRNWAIKNVPHRIIQLSNWFYQFALNGGAKKTELGPVNGL